MMKKVFNDLALYDVHQNRNEKKLDIYVPLQTKAARTVTKMKRIHCLTKFMCSSCN